MLTVIALGAGVQSSVMAMLAAAGEITPMPDAAIFADTQSEPQTVYDMVEWLTATMPYPVRTVTAGSVLDSMRSPRRGFVTLPTFIDGASMGKRQCTPNFKVVPIDREIRRLLGLRYRQHWPKEPAVEQWLGISVDEIQRARPSRRPAITMRYPLLELGLGRSDLVAWWQANAPSGAPPLAKSSCICCPYHARSNWLATLPGDLERAAQAEDDMNTALAGDGLEPQYLHRRRIPLRQAIAAERDHADSNPTLFDGGDCDSGYCFT